MAEPRVVLDPASGLVDTIQVAPPLPGTRLLWSISARVSPPSQNKSFHLDLAGACGPRRAETLARAAGEIVERWAVYYQELYGPPPAFPDAGPSGAAAGPDLEFCRIRGLRELVERDAVMRGWYECRGVEQLDTDTLLPQLGAIRKTVATCFKRQMRLVVLALPSRCADLEVIMGALLDSGSGIVACGLGCAPSRPEAAQSAVREACQIHDLYSAMRTAVGRPQAPAVIHNDHDRATWWGAPGNEDAFKEWLALADERSSTTGSTPKVTLGWEHLVETSSFVDLSGYLPVGVRSAGWFAGRTTSPHLTPLVMDETAAPGQALAQRSPHSLPHPII